MVASNGEKYTSQSKYQDRKSIEVSRPTAITVTTSTSTSNEPNEAYANTQ